MAGVRNKGPKTQRQTGKLGRRLPNKDGVAVLVMNGVAVVGGVQLNTVYKLISPNELAALKIDAAYDTTNKLLVNKHITDFFLYNNSGELYIMLTPQKVSTTEITPSVMCLKTNAYVKKALDDVRINFNAVPKLLGIAYNPSATYTPTIQDGVDADLVDAKVNLSDLLKDFTDNYAFINAVLEARSFNGTYADLVPVDEIGEITDPRIRILLAADPVWSAKDALYDGYSAIGAELGMMSLAAISENYGNPIDKFNLRRATTGATVFKTPGLSGGNALTTDNDVLDALEDKGYIFCEQLENVDGIYFNDTRTCVAVDNDYAYTENNRVIDKILLSVRKALIPLTTNARLQVDSNTGEMTLQQKTLLESAAEESLRPMQKDGDLSPGEDAIQCLIPEGIDILGGDELFVDVDCVPLAIGRKVTIRAGLNNPF